MTQLPRVLSGMRRMIAVTLMAMLVPVIAQAGATVAQARTNPQAASLAEFQKRLDAYLALREDLSKKLKPMSPTADAAQLTTRQESLAAALRTARKNAKQGDLIPAPVAETIAVTVREDFHVRNPQVKKATLEEVPNSPLPTINKMYPAQAALPTVPPLLLEKLPRLPDNLQYRFYGRHVVILDGDTQIITDYIANVLPPH
jgi:hypothetical protein